MNWGHIISAWPAWMQFAFATVGIILIAAVAFAILYIWYRLMP